MRKFIKLSIIFILNVVFLQFFTIKTNDNVYATEFQTSAESMVTIECETGRILYSKDAHKRLPMASTTKILTAIVAIENCNNLDKKYEIPKEAVGIEGSSIYLKAGEHLTVRELLYGLMLRSGNDSAVALAIIVGGTVDKFVKMMNDYAKSLGLVDTNIVTVNGLHDDKHYSSAYDLAMITAKAFENETFAEIVKTKQIKIDSELDVKNKCRFLKNKNKLLSMVEGADGVKTGYTTKAGKCFVGSAVRNGMRVVSVVLNSKNMFDDVSVLLNKAFDEYKMVVLFKKGEIGNINLKNTKTQKVPTLIKKDIKYPLKQDEIVKIYAKAKIDEDLKPPISSSNSIGKLEVYVQNNLIFSKEIYTINIEKSEQIGDYFKKIIKAF